MQNPYFSLIGISWRYARNMRARFIAVYGLYILSNLAAAAHPLVYGWFIDGLQRRGTEIIKSTWMYIGAFMILRVIEWCFHGPARVMERDLAFKISSNFMHDVYHKVLHLPMKWHRFHHTGSTINLVRKGYEALKEFCQGGFVYLSSFSKFIFSFIAMIYFSPVFGGIAVLLGVFTVWVIFRFDKPFVRSLKEVNEREHIVSSTLFDSLSNIMTVITLRLEQRMIQNIMGKVKRVFPAFRRNIYINEWKWFTSTMLVSLIFGITIIGYTYQNYIPGQTFYMGILVTLLIYVNQFTSVFNDIAFQYTKIVELHTDVKMTEEIEKAYERDHLPETKNNLIKDWKTLKITNLNFTYSEREDLVESAGLLKDINIEIERGKKIALIGESGSGKSTLLGLLRGLHIPRAGVELTVDGTTKKDFSCIANSLTLFPQDPEIFENTILYNITLGLPYTKEEVMRACEIAHFSEVVKSLPRGLDSNIQEKGINLSGGQKQRLALARGILCSLKSDIILLDEPTSSVDPKTEVCIYNFIFKAFENKAMISCMHRLHLLQQFDYVYILEKGKIVDEGSFKSLHSTSSKFYQLWKHQEFKPT